VGAGPNAVLHLLDAKFRVDRVDAMLDDEETPREDADERRGVFKRADLYKMHTYRDAIPAARSVWILYPGTDFRFFARAPGPVATEAAQVPMSPDGVGAIPLSPTGSRVALMGSSRGLSLRSTKRMA
jgi:predicted component of viral defense system (DUF524 family)